MCIRSSAGRPKKEVRDDMGADERWVIAGLEKAKLPFLVLGEII
jgi:hypothetical protein